MGQTKSEALFANIWAGDERKERGRFQRIRPQAINRRRDTNGGCHPDHP